MGERPHRAQAVGSSSDRKASIISSASGKRSSACFENISAPLATTSNWPRLPTSTSASTPSASLSEAAKLVAFGR